METVEELLNFLPVKIYVCLMERILRCRSLRQIRKIQNRNLYLIPNPYMDYISLSFLAINFAVYYSSGDRYNST